MSPLTESLVRGAIYSHRGVLEAALPICEAYCREKRIAFDRIDIRDVNETEIVFQVIYAGARCQGPILGAPTARMWADNE